MSSTSPRRKKEVIKIMITLFSIIIEDFEKISNKDSETKKPNIIEIPPNLTISFLCCFLFSGLSKIFSFIPALFTNGTVATVKNIELINKKKYSNNSKNIYF